MSISDHKLACQPTQITEQWKKLSERLPLIILAGGGGGFFSTFTLPDSKNRLALFAKSDFAVVLGAVPSVMSLSGPITVLLCAVLRRANIFVVIYQVVCL